MNIFYYLYKLFSSWKCFSEGRNVVSNAINYCLHDTETIIILSPTITETETERKKDAIGRILTTVRQQQSPGLILLDSER